MKTIFDEIHVGYSEFKYFNQLPKRDQVHYFFDVYEAQYSIDSDSSIVPNLTSFFESVKDQYNEQRAELRAERENESDSIESFEFDPDAPDRVDVMIDDSNIMIESNNLKALRVVTYKFVESGYILQRDIVMEKLFKRDKLTRYLRIFKIINQVPDLCTN